MLTFGLVVPWFHGFFIGILGICGLCALPEMLLLFPKRARAEGSSTAENERKQRVIRRPAANIPSSSTARVPEDSAPQPLDNIIVLDKKWLDLILSGSKTLEIRYQPWQGVFYLGCGCIIYGRAKLTPEEEITTMERYKELLPQHHYSRESLPHKHTWALRVSNVERIPATPYHHSKGAQGRLKYVPVDAEGLPVAAYLPKNVRKEEEKEGRARKRVKKAIPERSTDAPEEDPEPSQEDADLRALFAEVASDSECSQAATEVIESADSGMGDSVFGDVDDGEEQQLSAEEMARRTAELEMYEAQVDSLIFSNVVFCESSLLGF